MSSLQTIKELKEEIKRLRKQILDFQERYKNALEKVYQLEKQVEDPTSSHHTHCQDKRCAGDTVDGWCTARDYE
jgi:predicted  nucleic acid-binding Zn-ribbon protein